MAKEKIQVTYLMNSGFLVRCGRTLLVFDDYLDEAGVVAKAIAAGDFDQLYIFASHAHFDHFDQHIQDYAPAVTRYIFSYDIRRTVRGKRFPQEQVVYLNTYSEWQDEQIAVQSFDSTDCGVSFRVTLKAAGRSIFHAGDFNWWDWLGDTAEHRQLAANAFHKQLKRLEGMQADVAFFPVDGRLEASQAKGAKEFCAATDCGALVTMHSPGYPAWQPPAGFFAPGKEIPVWSPRTPGESRVFE
ncbi:MAG: MBL fold metallo-hydrolase [Selenomonas sp.]|jgi:L-ascorbate metabolism protein UlaG (beta-lactamase superfamily)|nr:MBL fold metallo-hydrolase [Selenomonas sp.]